MGSQRKSKLKMWIGNLDGVRQGLVISTSKNRARKIVHTSLNEFNGYWALQPSVNELLEVDVLYTRKIRDGEAWHIGRCPL